MLKISERLELMCKELPWLKQAVLDIETAAFYGNPYAAAGILVEAYEWHKMETYERFKRERD